MHAKRLICSVAAFFVVALSVFLLPLTLSAQWQQTYSFPSQIRSIYFLNNQGQTFTGFVGLVAGEIWRTNDNGQTWKKTNTPQEIGSVTSFSFKDAAQGWCSVRPLLASQSSCWMTIDGGLNWVPLSPAGNSVDVSFNAASQLLFLSCWTGSSLVSGNLGQTWTAFAPSSQNGIAWSDPTHGILSVLNGTFFRTADGGQSWQMTPQMGVECWSPCGVTGPNVFLAAGEKTRAVYRSLDNGATWSPSFIFNPTINLIGDIEGSASMVFVQTINSGFYASTDLGTSWQSICGPSNDRDTRFYTKGTEIFAGTPSGNLWYLPNATSGGVGPNPLAVQKSQLRFLNLGCFSLDSLVRISYNGNCPLSFTRVQLTGSSNFRLGAYGALPHTIQGNDSLHVIYSPTRTGADTAQLLVEYFINYVRFDTIINLYGTALRTMDYSQSMIHWFPLFGSTCDIRDTSVLFKNRSCDTLFITAAGLDDSTAFQLGNLQLPVAILPGDSSRLYLHCEHHAAGDFATQLHVSLRSASQQRDTTLPLEVVIPSVARPTLDQFSATLATKCVSLDTSYTIRNLICDSITLKSVGLSDSTFFTLLDRPAFVKLGPNDTVVIHLHLVTNGKGLRTAQMLLEFLSGSTTLDTSIVLTARTAHDIPISAALSRDHVAFGPVSTCNAKQIEIRIKNDQCRDLMITKVTLPDQDSTFESMQLTLPDTLHAGATDSMILFFHPHKAGSASAYLTVTFSADGTTKDTLIEITGAGYEVVSAEFEPPSLDLGAISACETSLGEAWLVNYSCDSVYVTEARLTSASAFVLGALTLPVWLHRGDSLLVKVTVASTQMGPINDTIEVRMRPGSTSAPEVSRLLNLRARVVRSAATLSLLPAGFVVHGISPCAKRDTTITFSNPSLCDSLTITSLTTTGDPILDYAMPLPVTLPPGASIMMSVTLHPQPGAKQSATIHIKGPATDTAIVFVLSAKQPDRTFSLVRTDSIFTNKPCEIVRHQYTITSTGCQSVTIDSVMLRSAGAQMRFAFDSSVALPTILQPGESKIVYLLYDANQAGDSLAALTFTSTSGQRASIRLTGIANGSISHVRLELVADDGSYLKQIKLLDGARALLVFRDPVSSVLGLTAIQCQIAYDCDVLELVGIDPSKGWSVIDTTPIGAGRYSLTLGSQFPAQFNTGDALASIRFVLTVGKNQSSGITLSDVRFNRNDSLFANCILAADVPRDLLTISIHNECGDSLIRVALSNEPLIVERVTPNPIFEAPAYIEVDLVAQQPTIVKVSIVDASGVTRRRWTERSLDLGKSKLLLDMDGLSNGVYFLTLESPYQTVVRKVVIAR
jgi:photosystem II stability/assembly factor-like uncharacterized protein